MCRFNRDKLLSCMSIFLMFIAICFVFSVSETRAALPTFTAVTDADLDIGEDVLDVDLGDLDNDGLNDIAAITKTGSTYKIRIWENTTDGAGGFATSNTVYSGTRVLKKLILANLNSTTNANTSNDIVVCATYDGATSDQQIMIWRNPSKAAGTVFADSWNSGSPNAMFGGGTANLNDIEVGELDGDDGNNYVDVVVGRSDGAVAIWQNPEAGGEEAYSAWSTTQSIKTGLGTVTCVSIGNIDGGSPAYKDVAAGNTPGGSTAKINIYQNPTASIYSSGWTELASLATGATTTTMTDVVIADLNGTSATFGDVTFTRGDSSTAQKSIVAKTNPESTPFAGIGTWGTINIRQDGPTTGTNYFYNELAFAEFTYHATDRYLDVIWAVDDNVDSIPRIQAMENTTGSAYANASNLVTAASGSVHAKTVATGFINEAVSGNGTIDIVTGFTNDATGGVQEVRVWTNGGTTAVELAYFKAKPKKGKIVLRWKTKTETDNELFNVLRSDSADGTYETTVCTEDAKGSTTKGAKYKCVDTGVESGSTYYYKLEDVDTSANSNLSDAKKVRYRKKGKK